MIINNKEQITIKGTDAEIFSDFVEIFCELHGKMEIKLTDEAPEYLKEYITNFNYCIKQATNVVNLLQSNKNLKEVQNEIEED